MHVLTWLKVSITVIDIISSSGMNSPIWLTMAGRERSGSLVSHTAAYSQMTSGFQSQKWFPDCS